ncbi:MAG: YceI family protein [Flavobacteriaceae bacterium]|nr:YceI family protein [Flavobacteriaceae bacterium]
MIIIALGIVIGGGIFLYMFFQPHRDVQATKTDFQLEAKQIVDEYLKDAYAANDKYLQEEGDSKIIEVSGVISEISEALIYSVPMQSFEFEKSMMQKHFNSNKFLDTKQFPKAKFKGMINNLSDVDFATDGAYTANVTGDLTIRGATKSLTQDATITVAGGEVTVDVIMDITLADYEIAFKKGKPSTNVAKTVKATIKTVYK